MPYLTDVSPRICSLKIYFLKGYSFTEVAQILYLEMVEKVLVWLSMFPFYGSYCFYRVLSQSYVYWPILQNDADSLHVIIEALSWIWFIVDPLLWNIHIRGQCQDSESTKVSTMPVFCKYPWKVQYKQVQSFWPDFSDK